MTTNAATNIATQNSGSLELTIDFDKKKLTERALQCETEHRRLQVWLQDPFIKNHMKMRVKDFRLHNLPCPLKAHPEKREELQHWRANLSSQRLSPLYQTLISQYYATLIQNNFNLVDFYQALKKIEFGSAADYIVKFYTQHEEVLATTLVTCYHARDKKFHQQPWFQLFFEAWDWALKEIDQTIQTYCFRAVYLTRAQELLENKTFNERQYQFALHLMQEKNCDRKSLQRCLWYKTLYRDLTKRTQERDYVLLIDFGFI